ncbi:hypothetical protein [Marinobacter sediminum]|uniref:hypothetical protein n=1 Tax=Marinobacter sediminum TaxID=256323 RepID=UPI00193A41E4|nr:hypothetical protein [Marinobacter sediminum]
MQYLFFGAGDTAHDAETSDELPAQLNWRLVGGQDLVFSHTPLAYWIRLKVTNPDDYRSLW